MGKREVGWSAVDNVSARIAWNKWRTGKTSTLSLTELIQARDLASLFSSREEVASINAEVRRRMCALVRTKEV